MTTLPSFQVNEILQRYKATTHLNHTKSLLKCDDKDRQWTLRAHYLPRPRGAPIYDQDEIAARDNCDSVLEIASVLEVVAIATGSELDLPLRTSKQFFEFLSDKHVRSYYECYYPVALPTLFRLRLLNELPAKYRQAIVAQTHKGDIKSISSLVSFLALDARRLHNKDLALFLDLIDDYTTVDGKVNLRDTLNLLNNVESFESRVLKHNGGTSGERQALRGLNDFIRFTTDYSELLTRINNQPLLRSSIWLHNCYWFGVGGGSVQYTAENLKWHLTKWTERRSSATVEGIRDLQERVRKILDVLSGMIDWRKHAKPLVLAAHPLLVSWTKAVEKERRRRS
jgi:hypothetical protein